MAERAQFVIHWNYIKRLLSVNNLHFHCVIICLNSGRVTWKKDVSIGPFIQWNKQLMLLFFWSRSRSLEQVNRYKKCVSKLSGSFIMPECSSHICWQWTRRPWCAFANQTLSTRRVIWKKRPRNRDGVTHLNAPPFSLYRFGLLSVSHAHTTTRTRGGINCMTGNVASLRQFACQSTLS